MTETIPLGGNVAVGGGAVWLGEMTSNRIARADPRTGRVTGVWRVGLVPPGIDPRRDPVNAGLVVAHGSLWAANWAGGRLLRLRLPGG